MGAAEGAPGALPSDDGPVSDGPDLDELQLALDYGFSRLELLELALNHESYANEQGAACCSNERLEFLGDAVLGLVVSAYLYHRHPDSPEGKLAQMKAHLVSTGHLAEKARAVDLGSYIRLGRGEQLSEGRERVNLLADCFEAVIGAVYLDGGLAPATALIMEHLREDMDDLSGVRKDYKSLLQETTQKYFKSLPEYLVVNEEGPPHDRTFQVEVVFGGQSLGEGTGRSKREASQKAANAALDLIESQAPVWMDLLSENEGGAAPADPA